MATINIACARMSAKGSSSSPHAGDEWKYGLVVSYDSESGLTRALLHCKDYGPFLLRLEQLLHLARNSMFLPILIAQMVVERSSGQMSIHQRTITEKIDVTTGHNFYKFAKKVNRSTMQFRESIRTGMHFLRTLHGPIGHSNLFLCSMTTLRARGQILECHPRY